MHALRWKWPRDLASGRSIRVENSVIPIGNVNGAASACTHVAVGDAGKNAEILTPKLVTLLARRTDGEGAGSAILPASLIA